MTKRKVCAIIYKTFKTNREINLILNIEKFFKKKRIKRISLKK